MKIFNMKNLNAVLTPVILTMALSVPSTAHAQDGDKIQSGFEQGRHEGHQNENGKQKGLENERNPWNDFYQGGGVDVELTIHHHGIIPTMTFTATYNSLMTIREVIADIVDESEEGFYLQECYEDDMGLLSDCEADESPTPLDSSLTLEAAGLVEDPEAHLVYQSD